MATRTPSLQERSRVHSHWGVYATGAELPNGSANPLASAHFYLEEGDIAYVVATTTLYVCTSKGSPSGGNATWAAL